MKQESSEPSRSAWALAYRNQSKSDFGVYELLTMAKGIPPCHALHYLQMAGEKIAKAYQFRDTERPVEKLLTSHVAFARFFGGLMGAPRIKQGFAGRDEQLEAVTRHCRHFAGAIEKLAPAVDRSVRPENPEYPWADGAKVVSPLTYEFALTTSLRTPQGITFLKFFQRAIDEFDDIKTA